MSKYNIDLDVDQVDCSNLSSSMSPSHFSCRFDPISKADKLLMLVFDSRGNSSLNEMSRQDVLRMAQDAAKEVARERVSPIVLQPSVQETTAGCDVQPVHARDIRRMENVFSVSNEPSIVIRKQAIFFSADPLRAIVLRDVCLVYVPDGADSLLSMLKHYFVVNARDNAGSPYEFRALEALLATLSRSFRAQYDQISPATVAALERLAHGHLDPHGLERLREFKNTMNEFEFQVDGVRRVLMELLDNEEDLRLLYLTKLFEDPSLLENLFRFDSEEAEVLIENYLQAIFSTRTTAELLQHRITNTESLVTLKLDSKRNYLLKVQLIFSLVSLNIAVGTMVSGMFGMNLTSGFESAARWFWGVVTATFVFFVLSTGGGIVFFKQKGVMMK
ncbi:CorA Metal Ion Transporter [Phytophthora megakarya]|uniref:Magnesium transporter n=1 Tax=Phytophthora megakarya TaxID=4795 RepID=A0A225X0M1_9STRA|nr:CorA Metal Ion Transporter [Phytophthora megakarya]